MNKCFGSRKIGGFFIEKVELLILPLRRGWGPSTSQTGQHTKDFIQRAIQILQFSALGYSSFT